MRKIWTRDDWRVLLCWLSSQIIQLLSFLWPLSLTLVRKF